MTWMALGNTQLGPELRWWTRQWHGLWCTVVKFHGGGPVQLGFEYPNNEIGAIDFNTLDYRYWVRLNICWYILNICGLSVLASLIYIRPCCSHPWDPQDSVDFRSWWVHAPGLGSSPTETWCSKEGYGPLPSSKCFVHCEDWNSWDLLVDLV